MSAVFSRHWRLAFVALLLCASMAQLVPTTNASPSVPHRMLFKSRLLKSNGTAVTSEHKIRFTFWIGSDAVPSDLTGTGSINVRASNFVGWKEEQTFTPDSSGNFYLEMGSVNPLPEFNNLPAQTLANLYLQVEVKPAGSPDSSYEILDPKPLSPTIDRSPVLTVPFALNADRLDQRDIGTGSGSIPLLGSGGVIRPLNAPKAMRADDFTIDSDNNAPSSITLKFGEALGKTLSYNILNGRFEFNADVRISGNLTVTGLVNGLDLTGFSGGSGSVVNVLQPQFPGAALAGDGDDNVGQLVISTEASTKRNFYLWSSTRPTLQDYGVFLRMRLPAGFRRWEDNPLAVDYRTANAENSVNAVSVEMFDTAGNGVSLTGGSDLAATTWTRAEMTFGGTPTWAAGGTILLKITPSAKATGEAHIGDVVLRYVSTGEQ